MTFQIEGFQVNLFAEEIEPTVAFYRRLGFRESFRTPLEGPPTHVEVRAAGLTIGVSSQEIGNDEFGLELSTGANSSDVVLWVVGIDDAHASALQAGGAPVFAPDGHQDGRLRHAWVRDPSRHLIGLVEERRATSE